MRERIATKAKISPLITQGVLDSFDISLTVTPATSRSLRVRRVRFDGIKANVPTSGPFEADFEFGPGVTALVTDSNLKGKSTILELITWALRGSLRGLRADIKPWLRNVCVEYELNGVPLAVKLESKDGNRFLASVFSATSAEALGALWGSDKPITSLHPIAEGLDELEFAEFQSSMMLDRFALQPITNWLKFPKSDDGRPQVHKWPSYFGAIYLPDAGSDVLLGDVNMAGLPARILQLFCDVPLMSQAIRSQVLLKQISQDERNVSRRQSDDAQALSGRLKELGLERVKLQSALSSLRSDVSSLRPLEMIEQELTVAESRFASAAATDRRSQSDHLEALAERQAEQRRVNDLAESKIATLLFHGLSPKHCPRCEVKLGSERVLVEVQDHKCAVCTSDLILTERPAFVVSSDSGVEDDLDVVDALSALIAAEAALSAAAVESSALRQTAKETLDQLHLELTTAGDSRSYQKRRALELDLARTEGSISAIPTIGEVRGLSSNTSVVLKATVDVLDDVTRVSANQMFAELDEEITLLGRRFGIENLDSVALSRNGGLKVTTAGVPEVFSKISGGERVRLRVALLIALLRIGARRGNGTHPGLILLDSPGAHELKTEDERTLLHELNCLQEELPGLQVIVTTAKPDAVRGVVDESQFYFAPGEETLW